MNLQDALDKIIDIGLDAARQDYAGEENKHKREGAVEGFNLCRGKSVPELTALLAEAGDRRQQAFNERAMDYWYWRCREAEIEWVCNVISAILMNEGQPVIVHPTARGMLMANRILRLEAA